MLEEIASITGIIILGSAILTILVVVIFFLIKKSNIRYVDAEKRSRGLLRTAEERYKEAINSILNSEDHNLQFRKDFHESGLLGFSDKEVIEFLLSFKPFSGDIEDISRRLIEKFGSLRGVIDGVISEQDQIPWIDKEQMLILRLIKDVSERYLNQNLTEYPLGNSPNAIYDYLKHTMRTLEQEVFKVVSLNADNRIINIHDAATGSVTEATVHVREVIKHLLIKNAVSVVFVHNHLVSRIKPSMDDLHLTKELKKACELMNINLLDHIIIGNDNTYYSFADAGLIERR